MEKKVFPQGFILKSKKETDKDFVKGRIAIKVDEFIGWLKENEKSDGWVNLDVLESSKGNVYPKLNDWKPEQKEQEATQDTYEPRDKFQF